MMTITMLTGMLMLACGSPRAGFTPAGVFAERDEIKRTFRLAPGARVEVSGIRGPVEIATSETGEAEVQIIRTARSRADLEYHLVTVEQTGSGLSVRGVQETGERMRRNVQVNHQVILKLPRRIDLAVSSISGSFRTGDVEGALTVSSVSGDVTLGGVGGPLRANSVSGTLAAGDVGGEARVSSVSGDLRLGRVGGALEVSDVSGSLSATLARLDRGGVRVRSVSGSVNLRFSGEVNADFSADQISGRVRLDVPNVTVSGELKPPNVRARIGAGGTPITLSSISGDITLSRV
jgi:hypothetical protein